MKRLNIFTIFALVFAFYLSINSQITDIEMFGNQIPSPLENTPDNQFLVNQEPFAPIKEKAATQEDFNNFIANINQEVDDQAEESKVLQPEIEQELSSDEKDALTKREQERERREAKEINNQFAPFDNLAQVLNIIDSQSLKNLNKRLVSLISRNKRDEKNNDFGVNRTPAHLYGESMQSLLAREILRQEIKQVAKKLRKKARKSMANLNNSQEINQAINTEEVTNN